MEIKEAVEISKIYGLLHEPKLVGNYETPTITVDISLDSYESIMAIEVALDSGYTLCKVDEAEKNMKALIKKYADNPIYDERIEAVYECLEILKAACDESCGEKNKEYQEDKSKDEN